MKPDEETRAAQFRADQQARATARAEEALHGLPGDAAARAALDERWEPWGDPTRDWDPVETYDEDGMPPQAERLLLHRGRGQGRELA